MNDGPAAAAWASQPQRLPLAGHRLECARHLVLRIADARAAGRFLADLLGRGLIAFGADDTGTDIDAGPRVDVAFTWAGLKALGAPQRWEEDVQRCSPAFVEGAVPRAARYLGDAGPSAASDWEKAFRPEHAHLWLVVHGATPEAVDAVVGELQHGRHADGLAGWDDRPLPPCRVLRGTDARGKPYRRSHFGFRDDIARPGIRRRGAVDPEDPHAAGELLVGHPNDAGFDLWFGAALADDLAGLLRDGTFGVLRQMAQDEAAFNAYLEQQVRALQPQHPFVDIDYLKAKLCGRWPNGALVEPGEIAAPADPAPARVAPNFGFAHDPEGRGCPFGAHIRRTNPRDGPLTPPRLRTLFRRGMSYGPAFTKETVDAPRGLMGVFVCTSIEDQFERLMSEWVEKTPMGPPDAGHAKDPLIGQHDDPEAGFTIPQAAGVAPIVLKGFGAPFVTTRGTLYAFFPSRRALDRLVKLSAGAAPAAVSAPAASGTSGLGPAAEANDPEAALEAPVRRDAPADRFCDIVMEGGITSGIIYASAVAELAREYRLKNIGGSSIGAFGAALAAAAEYRRRHGSDAGFEAVAQLPDRLAEADGSGRTLLERLFMPQRETRRLFAVFLATLNRSSGGARAWAALRAAFIQYRRWAWTAAALCLLVWIGPLAGLLQDLIGGASPGVAVLQLVAWLLPWLATLLIVLPCAVTAGAVRDLLIGVVPNGYGLCRGWQEDRTLADPDLDLTGYLHASIQKVADRHPIDAAPLTFRDLWNAPGGSAEVLGDHPAGAAARSINLEVYSSNLSHGRPYRFPLDASEDMARLFFRLEDLARYFPEPVLRHVAAFAVPYRPASDADPLHGRDTAPFLELPAADLPIVVAVRLGMSFPGLISAVPLWAIDHEPPARADRRLERCWMSDGGLCSNFPIHLFDSLVPRWPTFGISLQNRSSVRPGTAFWLPRTHREGRAETWDRGLQRATRPVARLGSFLIGLWTTTWHWNDSTMMRMPGVRDRVVRIFLEPGEGGINIRMSAARIKGLATNYGRPAARAFIEKFANGPGWDEHRWVRFHTALIALGDRVRGLRFAADLDRHARPLREQIDAARVAAPLRGEHGPPWPSETPLSDDQAQRLTDLLDALTALETEFAAGTGADATYRAAPRPSLRIRHPT